MWCFRDILTGGTWAGGLSSRGVGELDSMWKRGQYIYNYSMDFRSEGVDGKNGGNRS
jgi:hypothetical protein